MSVRKRRWVTRGGEAREAWIVDYVDGAGERHLETFAKKKDADARHDQVGVDVRRGVHVAPSKSITLREAGKQWIEAAEAKGELERTTIDQMRQHVNLHLVPFIGSKRLTDITVNIVLDLETQLREAKRSKDMVKRVLVTLGAILADAHLRGQAARNAVRDLKRGRGKTKTEKRAKKKLVVGEDIPTPAEITAILAAAKDRWRPLLLVAAFTGLRASELRGLRWIDVDLEKKNEIHVRQRADRYNVIGPPKTAASRRVVPFGKTVANTLKAWGLRSSRQGLVFGTKKGGPQYHTHLISRGLIPAVKAAGLVDEAGRAKYTGLHALRHFYASWCINSRENGGLGLLPKEAQTRLGHSSIQMTFDTYGHLFPRGDDSEVLDAAESALVVA